ncbi:hypothetical protein [Paenibacillus sp. 2TAB19]|uniref:hypothetical protein n=1 Tax=Paenibacillus sp. 2TAB19 TaxID=3233003 RepID=UPI003F95DAE0
MTKDLRQKVRISLSPPEATFWSEIKYSVGKDRLVTVEPMVQLPDGSFQITLKVCGLSKAKALATLLLSTKSFGNTRVAVRVKSGGKIVSPITTGLTPAKIVALYRIAFRTNELFSFVVARTPFGNTFVYPVFKVRVVQFFNDDLSDFYSNYNNVAAFVFRNVLRNVINGTAIQFSTAQKKAK